LRPIVLAIAGSDSSAGAGIQADLKAIEANGAYAATVLTAITAQNTRGVRRADVLDPALVVAQMEAVLDDLPVAALKTGMLGTAAVVDAVAAVIERRVSAPLVCDPVMLSKTGHSLLEPAARERLVERLLPLATVITPNVHELATLAGRAVDGLDDAVSAAQQLVARGVPAVLATGGHLPGAQGTDLLVRADGVVRLDGMWIDTPHTHGTGCTLASALAARLARGDPLERAARAAKRFVERALAAALPLGQGIGPPDALFRLHGAPPEPAP
jgi:hydroxymethylpyrimidine/phosphomethylpyrimidine kinase